MKQANGHRGRMVSRIAYRRLGIAGVAAALFTTATLTAPATADTHTIYMTTSDSCTYDCAVAVMQVKGHKIRYKMSPAQGNGIYSVGWMHRRGHTVKGLVGGWECSRPTRQTNEVSGRGPRTHFVGMQVTTKRQARRFANRHSYWSVSFPDWPWTSPKQWRANYARFCE
ncbi:MAG: hypothetical protein R2720_12885 [Candidatus Nanopelagicales bacterium]